MTLDWSKQIQVLNKYVMDWRWKAIVANVDAAQLKTSVTDYLLPRMDIGLLHAEVSEKMCNAWLATVIHTICERAKMSNAHSINRKAFCLLADLPDLWMRTQTSRATDLLVNLNTKYAQNGRSTVARLCALIKQSPKNLPSVIQLISSKDNFRCGPNRISTTLKYLKSIGVTLASPVPAIDDSIVGSTSAIREAVVNKSLLYVYTDGSTKPRSKEPNSGFGIYITDSKHQPVWQGGGIVRTDGNNFIAEIAAAAIVVKAIPLGTSVTVRIDSMATIGALSQGVVSERKRIRAAGRAWVNWCREDLLRKHHILNFKHITSHQENKSNESLGNNKADAIANVFRREGELKDPHPYFTLAEERIVYQLHGNNIQGDIRQVLKSIEKERMLEMWMKKAKVQSAWMKKYPTQIMKQAKCVWKASILKEDGRAWVYFIFAICQWLPTNYRLFSKIPNSLTKTMCLLCLGRKVETFDHILKCPALASEMEQLRASVQTILSSCGFPFASLQVESAKRKIVQNWTAVCSPHLPNDFPGAQLERMLWDFFNANKDKQFISYRDIVGRTSAVVAQMPLKGHVDLPADLLLIIVQELSLWIEAKTDSIHRNRIFSEWYSLNWDDSDFGSQGTPLFMSFRGGNTYLNLLNDADHFVEKMIELLQEHLSSPAPTRTLIVGDAKLMSKYPKDPRFMPIGEVESAVLGRISMVLVLNKASMIVDPISWDSLVSKISDWSNKSSTRVIFSMNTDALFRERLHPRHRPRARTLEMSHGSGIYSFFEPRSQLERSWNKIHPKIPAQSMHLLQKINTFDPKLLILGILPNQLRSLAKIHSMKHMEESLLLLSEVLFWEGYELWKKRKKLVTNYWQNIAPQEWKVEKKERKLKGKRRLLSTCKNPFHFCEKLTSLSTQRRSLCACSDKKRIPRSEILPDIRCFLTKYPQWAQGKISFYGKDRKDISKIIGTPSQDDFIRQEHDRGKKKKRKKRFI